VKVLESAIHGVLKPQGFTKKGATWRRVSNEIISVLNLQKSQWGDDYYINVGVFIKSVGSREDPRKHDCHIRGRPTPSPDGYAPTDPDAISLVVREFALPWLDRLMSRQEFAASWSPRNRATF
jgi:hypothetical protein